MDLFPATNIFNDPASLANRIRRSLPPQREISGGGSYFDRRLHTPRQRGLTRMTFVVRNTDAARRCGASTFTV